MREAWRPIPGYEDTYEVSNLGTIRRLRGSNRAPVGFVLRQTRNRDGYLNVGLTRNGRQKTCNAAHRLVWSAFRGPIPQGMVVNHKNGKKDDNRLTNLECVTVAENVRHAFSVLGRNRGGEKLDATAVIAMRRAIRDKTATLKELGERYGITASCVSSVVTGRTWGHVGGPITPSRAIKQTFADVAKRISDDDVRSIILRFRAGETAGALAEEYDVNRRTIYNWIEGRSRARVVESLDG